MYERVLPLRAIAVFEAAARVASFHAAADELNLTPSAVSHQIRLLEDILGVRLFERVGRGVALTPEGADYARSVRQSIRRLRMATSDIKARGKKDNALEVVRIETPPSFARCWLLPHLPDFLAKHPSIDLRINAQGAYLQGDRLPWTQSADAPADLQIVYGDPDLWQDRASLLVSEIMQPLCAPSMIEWGKMSDPRELLDHMLINSQNHISWEEWLDLQGLDLHERHVSTIQLDPSHLAIEAAVNGVGIIFESDVLAGHELACGHLVAPFPQLSRNGLSYWMLMSSPKSVQPALGVFVDWLKERAASRAA
jgi:LysR family glycine cleavage system transcriptional activator